MDSLANYGSDDEYDESTSEKMGTSGSGGNRTRSRDVDNYDEVQMDLSEESNNNISAEDDDQKVEKPSEKKRLNRSHSRDDPRSSRSSDSRSKRDDRDKDRYRRDREDRYEKKYDKISKTRDDKRKKRSPSREKKRSISKDRKRSCSRERRRSNSRNRRSGSREKRRSGSKERRRSGSKERRRSGSKERRRSRSPRRDERRRRSSSKDRTSGSNSRYGKRFDRTSNKIAQLEKLGIEIKTPDAEFVSPQMLLQRSMDEQVQKVKNSTGIELPKYYNPAAMNPARYADQIQKRRLLWQKKDPVVTTEAKPMGKVWEQTTFAQDSDGKVASKFKRLMGIKDQPGPSGKDTSKDILKKQEEMFSSMEQQYEVARTATHTMRGVGLGFGAFNNYPR